MFQAIKPCDSVNLRCRAHVPTRSLPCSFWSNLSSSPGLQTDSSRSWACRVSPAASPGSFSSHFTRYGLALKPWVLHHLVKPNTQSERLMLTSCCWVVLSKRIRPFSSFESGVYTFAALSSIVLFSALNAIAGRQMYIRLCACQQ